MEELKNLLFLSGNQNVGSCLICNSDTRTNDASILRDDGWKTLMKLAKKWSSVVLPIDHQYYWFTQVHEAIGDSKTTLCKQYSCLAIKWRKTMKLIKLMWRREQHLHRFYRMHLCWTRNPVQLELIQALEIKNRSNKFALLAMKFIHTIRLLITRVIWEFLNSKVQEIGWSMLRMQL